MTRTRKPLVANARAAALRSARLSLRASPEQDRLIRRAAAASHKNVTEFILESACSAAQQVLSDRRLFLLDDRQWQRLVTALDRPVSDKPRLRALLSEPTVIETA